MNCQDFLTRLHPSLDGELESPEERLVHAHLSQCSPCAQLFTDEKRCWNHVASRLGGEVAPAGFDSRLRALLDQEDARATRHHRLRWVIPLGAAAAVLLVFALKPWSLFGGDGHDHGASVRIAASIFERVTKRARDLGVPMVSPKILSEGTFEVLEGPRATTFLREVVGDGSPLLTEYPAGFTTLTTKMDFDGMSVPSFFFEDDAEDPLGVFKIPSSSARLNRLVPMEEGSEREVTVEHCMDCDVLALKRGGYVYLVVSSNRAALERLARRSR